MKKEFSIFITALILVSGMHLSMASHLCQGEVVAVKWSFAGKLAGCGMEVPEKSCPIHEGIARNCCQNIIAYLTVDNNYFPSTLQVEDPARKHVKVSALSVSVLSTSLIYPVSSYANVSPPRKSIANEVSLACICVFRI